jgi:signal transduction histidine kinase
MSDPRRSVVLFQNAFLMLIAAVITGVIFLVDSNTDHTVSVASMYSIVILYSWLLPGRYTSIYAAMICSVLTVFVALEASEVTGGAPELSAINWLIALVVIWTCVVLVFIARSSHASLEDINNQLSRSSAALLEKVKELDSRQQELSQHKQLLENLNADLLVKNRELERFTSIASHDLQEPLRTIGNMTQLLTKKYHANFDDQGNKILDYVSTAATRMTLLIRGLLVLVHDMPRVNGNPVELRMLFQNLISNGLKFTRDGIPPAVDVSATDIGAYWEFCVRDEGIGISPEDQEKIFYIFQRLHRSEKYEGSGLGLAYCRKIVEIHGGKIGVRSNDDAGSSFYFTLKKTL